MDVSIFMDKPCKFRLRSGKEVYGVIWQELGSRPHEVMFASSGDYLRMQTRQQRKPSYAELEDFAIRLNRDELIAAEILDNL